VQIGFLHALKSGRPSLALDVLELFRTQADAFVVTLTNRSEFSAKDFESIESGEFYLTKAGLKRFLMKFGENAVDDFAIERACREFLRLLMDRTAPA
jgi:CRISPR-associated protein Cas1